MLVWPGAKGHPRALRRWLVEVEDWPPEVAEQLAVEYEYGRELLAFASSGDGTLATVQTPQQSGRDGSGHLWHIYARTLAGVTQRDLATMLGINERAVRFWERKHDRRPTSAPNDARIEQALLARGVILFAEPTPGARLAKKR